MKKKILFLALLGFIMISGQNVFANETDFDEFSTDESDLPKIQEGIRHFESFVNSSGDNHSIKSQGFIGEGMEVTPLSGEFITLSVTDNDPLYLLVKGENLESRVFDKLYESLTESNQSVVFAEFGGKIQVASITRPADPSLYMTLSVDPEIVSQVIETYNYNPEKVKYYKSELFDVAIVSFEDETQFLIQYNPIFISLPGLENNTLMSKEEAITALTPLIEANADYFLDLDIESLAPDDFVYGGVRYDYSPANVKGTVIEAGVQITGNPGNSQIRSKTIDPVVLSSIAAGIFLAGALVYDKKRKKKVTH